ncbi:MULTISPECIES: TM2 domain-containing protein [unclassified Mycoplasma]|uniref:TM2 domain-containing protein n=1 Tax=unclassified Mycoplasma TaxID=2683645 RepID=UPI00216B4668|nr:MULTISPECIES: TM2 domain-containing protein [unclassified Mycoplasma]MCS4536522.1 TM2 domain-containing protein [Mycoplasma sp. CSL7475-4]MCT4469518.1 TM2 domain-containing protein [Mycoplasma sp. HS2188]
MKKSRLLLILLAIFFGYLGADRFYAGRFWLGLLKLLTGGLFGIMYIVDIILAILGLQKDGTGRNI